MENNNPWIFEADRLDSTPSIRDGITRSQESSFRIDGARFIHRLGNDQLNLNYNTVMTGCVFFHRFYMFHSFKSFPVYPLAATSLFLAGKVEETPKKSNDIVRFSKLVLDEQKFSQFGPDPKEEILTLERILLQTLRFDFEVAHPYEHLVRFSKQFKVSKGDQKDEAITKELIQQAWTFTNDSSCSTVCLLYEPEIIAVATIFLASKTGIPHPFNIYDWENRRPEHKFWWDAHVENLDVPTLESICHQVMDVYQYSQ